MDGLAPAKLTILAIVGNDITCNVERLRGLGLADALQVTIHLMEMRKLGLVSYRFGDRYIRLTSKGRVIWNSLYRPSWITRRSES